MKCVCVYVCVFFALKFSCYFRPGMYATPLLQHEYINGRRRKKKKYIRTYLHTYIRHDNWVCFERFKGPRVKH